MFVFSKKQFLMVIKARLRVKSNKKSRSHGLSEQKIKELLEDKDEWAKMTKLTHGRYTLALLLPLQLPMMPPRSV